MVKYRRNYLAGGTYFFTVNLQDRKSTLLVDHVNELRYAFQHARAKMPFKIDAIVILPEHIHSIFTLPDGDFNYASRWRFIKSVFTRKLLKAGVSLIRNQRGEYNLWQKRFWEHTIRDDNDMENHVDYIHFNPVKHKHVARVADWPYSSFHEYVNRGDLPMEWAGSDLSFDAGDD